MDLRQLRYFLAVASELHFGRAAEQVGIKQPPLSRQIKNLEEELGVTLFQRSKRRVELTPQGRYLQEEAQWILGRIQLARSNLSEIGRRPGGTLRVGYVGAAMHSVLPPILSAVREELPGIHTVLFERGNEDQLRALLTGELDLGFVRSPIEAGGLTVQPIFEELYALLLPSTHPAARSARPKLGDLADAAFIGFERTCCPGMVDQVGAICLREGFAPRITHTTSQINTILRLVEAGLGYSIVPLSVSRGYALDVSFTALEDIPERAVLSAIYNPSLLSETAGLALDLIARRPWR